MLGKPNLWGVENTEAIPRTYHRSRLQPGSTLFNSVRPLSSKPLPKEQPKETGLSFPWPRHIFIFFHSFTILFVLSRHGIASQTRKWPVGAGRNGFSLSEKCTNVVDQRVHAQDHTRACFLSWESILDLENAWYPPAKKRDSTNR